MQRLRLGAARAAVAAAAEYPRAARLRREERAAAAAGQLVLRGRGRGVSGQLPVLSAVHRGRHRGGLHGADCAHRQEYFPAGHRHEG